MKWYLKRRAKPGDYRVVEKFAYLPTRCVGNLTNFGGYTEYMVWLEHYETYEEYKVMMNGDGEPVEEWVVISNNVIKRNKNESCN